MFSRLALGVLLVSCQASLSAAEDNGLELLDEAVEVKVGAERAEDLERVVTLCEKSLEAGLDDDNSQFAKMMITSTLYERANRYVDFVLQGQSVHMWAQRRQLAMQDLKRLLKHNADHAEAHLLIARLQVLPGGDFEEGYQSAERAIQLLSNNPERLAAALVASANYINDPEEKLKRYEKAIDADAENLDAWRDRGQVKLLLGNTDEAIADFIHLLSKDDQDVAALQSIAQALADQEKFDEAMENLNKAIELVPDEPSVYTLRARIRLLQNEIDGAIEDLNEALRKDPRDVGALLMRATLRESKGEFDAALADVQRVLELRPGLHQAILIRSLILYNAGREQEAINEFKQLVRRDPKNIELLLRLAAMFTVNNQPDKAIEVYTDVLNLSEGNTQALHGRADALLSIGKHAEAIKDYELALESSSQDVSSILNNLAWVLATSPIDEVRNGEKAIELATKACEETAYKAAHIVSTLAAAYAEESDFDKAIEWSTKAVKLGDSNVSEQLQAELESYQKGKPWREMQTTEERPDPITPNFSDLQVVKEPVEAIARNTSQAPEDGPVTELQKTNNVGEPAKEEGESSPSAVNSDDDSDQDSSSQAETKKKFTDFAGDLWNADCPEKHKQKSKASDEQSDEESDEQSDEESDEQSDDESDDESDEQSDEESSGAGDENPDAKRSETDAGGQKDTDEDTCLFPPDALVV